LRLKVQAIFLSFLLVGLTLTTVGALLRPVQAQTWVEGHITQDTTWTIQDSPFIIINDVTIDANVTLTIQAGVEIKFGGNFKLIIEGNLFANGMESNPIIFTSNKADPVSGDWETIEFKGDSLKMNYCNISYAENGITHLSKGTAEIRYCNIILNLHSGIWDYLNPYSERATTIVDNTLVAKNGVSGVGWNGVNLTISNSILSDNCWRPGWSHVGGVGVGGKGITIYNCTISSNNDGYGGIWVQVFDNIDLTILNNRIFSNDVGINFHVYYSMSNINMSGNIVHSNTRGIYVHGGASVQNINWSRNAICYNTYGVFVEGGVSGVELHYNDIYSNTHGGYTTGATLDATYNYWGNATGPYHESMNPQGKGNSVNGDGTDLDFIPFLTSPVGTINQRPVAILEVDNPNPNRYQGEIVTFDASGSTDDGRIDFYFFDFGDGTNSSWTPLSIVNHEYAADGEYLATVIVMDDFGVTSFDGELLSVEITVIPEFPSWIILPLFILATFIAVLAKKKAWGALLGYFVC
jgi:parallel beta-helix repeat protein